MNIKRLFLSVSFLLIMFVLPNSAVAVVHPTPDNVSPNTQHLNGFSATSLDDLLNLNAKELGKKRGKKLKLKERLGLFIIKKEIKRARKKGKTDAEIIQAFNEPRDSGKETVAFLIGLLLGLIGVLIAYLFLRKQVRFAWYGVLTYLGILALALFYAFYNN